VEYVGHLRIAEEQSAFSANARAVLVPSTFEEPFGMVMIESLASGTPVIGLDSGAIPEVIRDGETGFVVPKVVQGKQIDEARTASGLAEAMVKIDRIDRRACRRDFESRFTLDRMVLDHFELYKRLIIRASVLD
jgi:glycosyltransferase involved in cell wall biosynthesis